MLSKNWLSIQNNDLLMVFNFFYLFHKKEIILVFKLF